MEEKKKTLKISLKTTLLISFLIILILGIGIIYFYPSFIKKNSSAEIIKSTNKINENSYENIFECYADINNDNNDEYIKVKCNTKYVEVPLDIMDDTGKRSRYTIYINEEKIIETSGDVIKFEVYDYDLDRKNEIILTLDAREWPTFCMYELVYKLEDDTLKTIGKFEKDLN